MVEVWALTDLERSFRTPYDSTCGLRYPYFMTWAPPRPTICLSLLAILHLGPSVSQDFLGHINTRAAFSLISRGTMASSDPSGLRLPRTSSIICATKDSCGDRGAPLPSLGKQPPPRAREEEGQTKLTYWVDASCSLIYEHNKVKLVIA